MGEVGLRPADEGEAVLLIHVPMEDVHLVQRHPLDHTSQRGQGEVVAAAVQQEAAVLEVRSVNNRRLGDHLVKKHDTVYERDAAEIYRLSSYYNGASVSLFVR